MLSGMPEDPSAEQLGSALGLQAGQAWDMASCRSLHLKSLLKLGSVIGLQLGYSVDDLASDSSDQHACRMCYKQKTVASIASCPPLKTSGKYTLCCAYLVTTQPAEGRCRLLPFR